MRRVLLGGLGIALGVLARPAMAQDFPPRSTTPIQSPAATGTRAARLGVPVAVPETATSSRVTPAGLVESGAGTPVAPPAISPTPTPTAGAPIAIGSPMGNPGSAPLPLPTPRTFAGPDLTEIRGPVFGGVPISPGVPPAAISGVPAIEQGQTGLPVLNPADCLLDIGVPAPAGAPALNRVAACRNPNWWVSSEYLMWWTRSAQLPTLVTTSSPASNGILGQPDTATVLGGSFGQTLHSGGRFSGGWWFNDNQCRGIDASFLFLFSSGTTFATNTNQFPVLARPFFNVNTPFGPFSEVVGTPGLANGSVVAHLDNSLWGAEVNYRRNLLSSVNGRLDGLVGFRYLNFTENLSISESFLRTPDSPMTVGTPAISGVVNDQFRATNNFYGGQLGLTGEVRNGRWFANARSSIAFGTIQETATIGGGQALNFGNGVVGQYAGGLLALPGANIGTFNQNKFAVMPELGLNIGYYITPHFRVFAGYNFLYLSNVLRAPGTIDTALDASRIPNFPLAGNPAPLTSVVRPTPQFNTTDFWAQGISFGMQWAW